VHALRPLGGGRRWRAYREDLWGFALGWLVVVALVGAAMALLAWR
jgi:hypothetical protein